MSLYSRFVFAALSCSFMLSDGVCATDPTVPEPIENSSQSTADDASGILNNVLVAAIATNRGDSKTSWLFYMKAASASRDARLAEKALDAAISMQAQAELDESVALLTSIDPTNERGVLMLAVSDLIHERHETAKAKIRDLLPRSTDPESLLLQFSKHASTAINPRDGYVMLSELAKGYEASPDIQVMLAKTAVAGNYDRRVSHHVDKAVGSAPDDMKILLECADIEFRIHPSKTTSRLEAFLQKHPDNAHVRLALARALIQTGSRDDILGHLKILNTSHGRSAHMQLQLGAIAEESHLYEQAKFHYRKLLVYVAQRPVGKLTPNTAYVRLGMIALAQKKHSEALDWLSKVQEGEHYIAAHVKRAEIYAGLRQPDNACFVLRSIRTDEVKQQVDLLRACAELYMRTKRNQDAVKTLLEAIELVPENGDLIYRTAMFAEQADMIDTAETLFKRFISLMPQDAQGYNSLGYMLLSRNVRIEEAAPLIERAMALSNGEDPYILDSMGWLKYRQGDLIAAERYLRRAQHIQPDTEVLLHLAQVLFAAGKRNEAEAIVRSVLTVSPDNAEAISILKTNGIHL